MAYEHLVKKTNSKANGKEYWNLKLNQLQDGESVIVQLTRNLPYERVGAFGPIKSFMFCMEGREMSGIVDDRWRTQFFGKSLVDVLKTIDKGSYIKITKKKVNPEKEGAKPYTIYQIEATQQPPSSSQSIPAVPVEQLVLTSDESEIVKQVKSYPGMENRKWAWADLSQVFLDNGVSLERGKRIFEEYIKK